MFQTLFPCFSQVDIDILEPVFGYTDFRGFPGKKGLQMILEMFVVWCFGFFGRNPPYAALRMIFCPTFEHAFHSSENIFASPSHLKKK